MNHGYETQNQALETYCRSKLLGIQPSAFVGIVRLTNFNA